MKGFVTVHLINAGALTIGVAAIVSLEAIRERKNGPLCVQVRLVDGRSLDIEEDWTELQDAIEEATAEPIPAPPTHPVPNEDGSYNVKDVVVEKKRGRPPKPKTA